jgi:cohesin complex subunit SA-1/2
VHGTHFNVLKQIKPDDVHDLHLGCIDWISRKVSGFVKQEAANKNREAKARLQAKRFQALTFFRPLALLISPITGRDAIRIRNHLQEQMEGTGARMDGGKQWDSYRAYEKRLVSVASRDENMKNASRRVVADSQKVPGQQGQQGTKRKAEAAAAAGAGEEDEEVRTEGSGSPSPEPSTPSKKRRLAPASTRTRNDDAEAEAGEGDMIVASQDEAQPNGNGETVDNLDLDVDLDLDLGFDLEMPELPLEMHEDLDLDLDLELPDLAPGSSQGRERSVSVDPAPRRNKLARKF